MFQCKIADTYAPIGNVIKLAIAGLHESNRLSQAILFGRFKFPPGFFHVSHENRVVDEIQIHLLELQLLSTHITSVGARKTYLETLAFAKLLSSAFRTPDMPDHLVVTKTSDRPSPV